METTEQIKAMVREKYSAIALQDKEDNVASCCGFPARYKMWHAKSKAASNYF